MTDPDPPAGIAAIHDAPTDDRRRYMSVDAREAAEWMANPATLANLWRRRTGAPS